MKLFFITNSLVKKIVYAYTKSYLKNDSDARFIFLYRDDRENVSENTKRCIIFPEIKFVSDRNLLFFIFTLIRFKIFYEKKFKCLLFSLTEDKSYHLYVPHTYIDSIIYTSNYEKCENLSLVEEGDASYIDAPNYDFDQKVKKRRRKIWKMLMSILGLRDLLTPDGFFPNESKVSKVLVTAKEAFPFYSNSKKIFVSIFSLCEVSRTSGPVTLIAIPPISGCIEQSVVNGLLFFLTENEEFFRNREVFLSIHPSIKRNNRIKFKLLTVLREINVQVKVSNFDSLELVLDGLINGRILGLETSLFRYAKRAGWECYSWLEYCYYLPDDIQTYFRTYTKRNNIELVSPSSDV